MNANEERDFIIAAVTNAKVPTVHPDAANTIDIGRAVLAAYRKLAAPTAQEVTRQAVPKIVADAIAAAFEETAGWRAKIAAAVRAIEPAAQEVTQQAAKAEAWMHEDGRVVAASTMESAQRDGGAMRSSLAGYTIPLGRITAPSSTGAARDAALKEIAELCSKSDLSVSAEDIVYAARQILTHTDQQAAKAEKGSANRDTVDLVTAVMDQFGFLDGVNEHRTEELCQALEAALNRLAPTTSTVRAPEELRNAFMTLESNGGEGRTIVLKFNNRSDAYAVHNFLLKGGGREWLASTDQADTDTGSEA